mmetsp:Transcript_1012/g.4155  ORF Transcript_1012/g.4155 Transcript_1012/m.4155 type:complete len:287 (+) Transcript_1012:1187-2047(+)
MASTYVCNIKLSGCTSSSKNSTHSAADSSRARLRDAEAPRLPSFTRTRTRCPYFSSKSRLASFLAGSSMIITTCVEHSLGTSSSQMRCRMSKSARKEGTSTSSVTVSFKKGFAVLTDATALVGMPSFHCIVCFTYLDSLSSSPPIPLCTRASQKRAELNLLYTSKIHGSAPWFMNALGAHPPNISTCDRPTIGNVGKPGKETSSSATHPNPGCPVLLSISWKFCETVSNHPSCSDTSSPRSTKKSMPSAKASMHSSFTIPIMLDGSVDANIRRVTPWGCVACSNSS